MADRTWLEAVAREPGKSSPWYRSHVLAIRPKLAAETLIEQSWLHSCTTEEVADAVRDLRGGTPVGQVVLGCDVGEGVGKSRSVIIVRDDLGVLEITANEYSSKNQTAAEIAHLAQKWRVPVGSIVFDGSGNTGRDILRALEMRYPFGLIPYFGSKPGGRWYTNLRTACSAALARRLNPESLPGRTHQLFHIPNSPHVAPMFKELGELRVQLRGQKSELETKEDLMLRLGRSPDYCDALCMTFRDEAISGV